VQRERGIICSSVFHRNREPIRVFKRAWKTTCKRARLPGRIPHNFRRTAVWNRVRAGIPERVAMTMTGHRTRSVFERNNIVNEGDLAEAARKLDACAGTIASTIGRQMAENGSGTASKELKTKRALGDSNTRPLDS